MPLCPSLLLGRFHPDWQAITMTRVQPTIDASNARTLQAFLQALDKLETSLPENLVKDIHQIGESLANNQLCVIACIRTLVQKDENLNACYQTECKKLHQRFQFQKRNKAGVPEDDTPPPEIFILENKLPRIIQLLQEPEPQTSVKKEREEKGADFMEIIVVPIY